MALLHEATVSPRKDELISKWLRTRPWWDGVDERDPVGNFRLDDPAGEVGIECFLFGSADGSTLFVPVTYRGAPLPHAESSLIGTMQHSVLGPRWVYDACADPVFVATAIDAIRTGAREAALELRRADGTVIARKSSASAHGAGSGDVPQVDAAAPVRATDTADCTVIHAGSVTLAVARRIGAILPPGPALTGSFAGGNDLLLATVSSEPV